MIVPTRPRREIVCAARGTTATCRRRGSSQRRLAVVQGTGQGDWQGPDPIVASVRTPPRPAPRAPAEGGSTYLAVGKRSCTLRAGFVAAERNPWYRPSLMGQRDGHRNRLKQVVRVLALTVVTSALPFTAAFAGVTGTDGPGEPSQLAPRMVEPQRERPARSGTVALVVRRVRPPTAEVSGHVRLRRSSSTISVAFPLVERHRAGGTR